MACRAHTGHDADCCRNIPISNNVAPCQAVSGHTTVCTRRGAPFRSRRRFARFQPGLALNRQGRTRSDPAISSITNCDQDSFYSNSGANRERDAQSLHRRWVFDRVKQTGVAISSDQLIPLQTSSMDVLSFRTHDRKHFPFKGLRAGHFQEEHSLFPRTALTRRKK